jgi:hypothetical protein
MKNSQRVVLACLVAASLLLAGLLFWPFLLNNVIKPTALVVWLLLRILVLSIHQKYFWYALIFAAAFFVFRVLSHARETAQPDVYLESNATLDNIEYWRVRFADNSHSIWDVKTLKRDLTHLLVSFYASNQNTGNNFEIHQALEQGKVPLPEHLRDFLFSQEPRKPDRSIKGFFRSNRGTPRRWIRRWTGQEQAEQYQRITETLGFMETSLEIKNDDGKFPHNES